MDQATLRSPFPTIHTPDDIMEYSSPSSNISDSNKPFLRQVSSDTRLHIPHFLSCQDKGFHANLPRLLENVSGFNSNQLTNSQENMDKFSTGAERKLSLGKPGLDRNKSAFELCSANAHNEEPAPLRKSSSVAQYNNISGSQEGISSHGSSSLLSSAFHFVTGNNNNSSLAVQKIPEEEDGGLKMMVTGSSFSPSALTSSAGLHADSNLVHSNSAHLPSTGLADIGSLTEKNKPKSGMLGVFNRGFFARPVLDDRESSYRYLLATEKF